MSSMPYEMGMGGGYDDSHGAPGGYPVSTWKTGGGLIFPGMHITFWWFCLIKIEAHSNITLSLSSSNND